VLLHELRTSVARRQGESILTPESLFFLTERRARDTAPAKVTGGPVAGGALIGVDNCWTHERMDERLAQEPSLLGRQFEPPAARHHLRYYRVYLSFHHYYTRATRRPKSDTNGY
jgi:hypothetical protein